MNFKNKFRTGISFWLFFFKIGCFTFGGGWSILAQMEQEFVEKRKMLTKEELMDLVAVGKSLPGIMITNISMLFGYRFGGVFGGVCSVLGISCPAVLILAGVTLCYREIRDNRIVAAALRGIRAAVVPIIGCAGISMGSQVLANKKARVICAVALALCLFTSLSNISMILTAAASVLILKGGKKLWF